VPDDVPVCVPEIDEGPVTASVGLADPERTTLLTEVGVMAPAAIVNAGVAPPLDVPLNPLAVAIDTAVTVPPPAGVANVPSPLKKVVVLFGGVGTAPPTVAVITGKSLTVNAVPPVTNPLASYVILVFVPAVIAPLVVTLLPKSVVKFVTWVSVILPVMVEAVPVVF
jgi:hypothetical protein